MKRPDDGLIEDVLGDHGIADAISSEQDDVGGGVDRGEREEVAGFAPVSNFYDRPVVD
jgi:hypothetical protein